jgi:hypothetical protein
MFFAETTTAAQVRALQGKLQIAGFAKTVQS